MADDPIIQSEPPAEPAWDFGPPKNEPSGVTKADFDRLERMIQDGRRPQIDPALLTTEAEKEAAAILEQLDKQPVKGFNAHTDLIVNRVAEKVTAAFDQRLGAMEEARQVDGFRETIVSRIGNGLGDDSKQYIRDYLSDYDMKGLRGLGSHKPTLDIIRRAAEHVGGTAGRQPTGSGGTSGGNGQPPSNITNEVEADAQEMFKKLGHLKGLTIEKCRAAVNLEGDTGMADPTNQESLRMGR